MIKLCLNTRDELMMVDLSKVVYFQANGNYTEFQYLCGEKHLVAFGLSKMEESIRVAWRAQSPCPFARLGRSLIVNVSFLREISLLRQRLVLGDCDGHTFNLKVSKPLLKRFKEMVLTARSAQAPQSNN